MPWTLTHDGVTKSFAEWGLEAVQSRELNQQMGELTASIVGDMLTALPWAFEDAVILRRDETVIWRGVVLPHTRSATGDDERVTVRFGDAWFWLANGTYSQAIWDANTEAAVNAARAVLFAAVTPGTGWARRTVGAEVTAIIAACDAYHGGGKIQLGTLSGAGFAQEITPQTVQNSTFEDALRQVLAWVPDAVTRIDHSTSPPTLHIAQRASATVRTFDFADGRLQVGQDITRRDDRVVTGVRLVYVTAGGVIVDAAGASSGSGVVEGTLDLTGGSGSAAAITTLPAVRQQYEVESEEIAPLSAEWWYKHGDTGAASAAGIIVDSRSNLALDPADPHGGSLGSRTRKFISGNIPSSEQDDHLRRGLVTGYLYVSVTNDLGEGRSAIVNEARVVQVRLTCTDLNGAHETEIKPAVTSGGGGGDGPLLTMVPTGVAAALLAVLGAAQYEGSLSWTEGECAVVVNPGDAVNLLGGDEEWETMIAQVQQVERNYDTGTTRVTLGLAEHLGVQEFMTLLKIVQVMPALELDRVTGAEGYGDTEPTEHPSMMPGYGSVTSSHEVKYRWEYLTEEVKYKFDGDLAKQTHESLDGTAKTEVSPSGTTVSNPTTEGRSETKADEINVIAASGDKVEITPQSVKVTDSLGAVATLTANSLTFTKDGKTTVLSLLSLLHDDGADTTMSLTEDQLVFAATGKLGTYEADALSLTNGANAADVDAAAGFDHTDGTDTAELNAVRMQIVQGGESATVTPEGGLDVVSGGNAASIDAVAGVQLAIGGGTVTITPVEGRDVSLMETEGCSDEGDPVTALVLRSLEVAV